MPLLGTWMRNAVWIGLVCCLVALPTQAWGSSKKDFCAVSDFFGQNKALNTTRTIMTYSITAFGGTLAALINIEAQRKTLETGLDGSSKSLRALSWAGPLKAFGRVAIPLMDNTNKVIKSAKLDSRTAQIYKKVYVPMSYAWLGVNAGMYAVQAAGVYVCGRAKIMDQNVTRSGVKSKAQKFAKLAKRYKQRIQQSVARLSKVKGIIVQYKPTFTGIRTALRPIQKPVKLLESGLKKVNSAMKPVFSAAKRLVKEMQKKRCVTYGVKVKVKVKKKVWKTKVKTKKVRFCFQISKVAGRINKLAKAAQKPVNDVINKVIKPLMKKIEKGLKKGLKIGALRRYQNKISALGRKLGAIPGKLRGFKAAFNSDKVMLRQAGSSLR
ncbi:MAG: hypothetical protein EP343_23835 [Deltaproteobacteria bacterium]|nr:MAG: hypothetical protein EP343_23835 [Deltaproteobacteria bacterium]